jgi:anti-anti-sigma factor
MEKLIISEERVNSPVSVTLLSLKGAIETTNASTLEEAIDRILGSQCYRIVVDLSGVTYISSAGWGIFISEIKRVRRNAGDIKLAAMTAPVREVFDLLEFNNILRPYRNKDEAVRDFHSVARAKATDEG